jgi:hypothetical protein
MGMSVDPNARSPLISGSLNTVPDVAYLGKSVLGLINLGRYTHDRSVAMGQAITALKGRTDKAVIITVSATKYGDRNFGGWQYGGTYVGRVQSVSSALDEVNGDHVYAINQTSAYFIVYVSNVCPANPGKAILVAYDDAVRTR